MSSHEKFNTKRKQTTLEHGDINSLRLCMSRLFCFSYVRRSCNFFIRFYSVTLFYIALWYFLSIAVILLNDWFMERYGFDYPIYISICHMITTFVCSSLLQHHLQPAAEANPYFYSWKEKLLYLGLMALFFGGDITFGNMAFDYMPVTSVQVINSSSTLIVLLLSLVMRFERFRFVIAVAVLSIVSGSVISSLQEIEGDTLGYLFAVISTIFSACKALLIATLLIPRGSFTPLQLLSVITLPILAALMPAFTWLELPKIICQSSSGQHSYFPIMSILVIDSLLAFSLNLCAFKLISITSALTYEVTGNFKEVIVFIAALFFFRDRLSTLNVVGNLILVTGVAVYSLARIFMDEREYESVPPTPDLTPIHSGYTTEDQQDDEPPKLFEVQLDDETDEENM